MIPFCGIDRCIMDANGRIKLNPRVLTDFERHGGIEVVLHCLPEGAIGVYPESTYSGMRRSETPNALQNAAGSMIFRRALRASGAMTQSVAISAQGRITVPPLFRELSGFAEKSCEVIVVGVEIGIEIWPVAHWKEEQAKIQKHEMEKGRLELEADLNRAGASGYQPQEAEK